MRDEEVVPESRQTRLERESAMWQWRWHRENMGHGFYEFLK